MTNRFMQPSPLLDWLVENFGDIYQTVWLHDLRFESMSWKNTPLTVLLEKLTGHNTPGTTFVLERASAPADNGERTITEFKISKIDFFGGEYALFDVYFEKPDRLAEVERQGKEYAEKLKQKQKRWWNIFFRGPKKE